MSIHFAPSRSLKKKKKSATGIKKRRRSGLLVLPSIGPGGAEHQGLSKLGHLLPEVKIERSTVTNTKVIKSVVYECMWLISLPRVWNICMMYTAQRFSRTTPRFRQWPSHTISRICGSKPSGPRVCWLEGLQGDVRTRCFFWALTNWMNLSEVVDIVCIHMYTVYDMHLYGRYT